MLGYVLMVCSVVGPGYIAIRYCVVNPITKLDTIITAMIAREMGFFGILRICWQLCIMLFGVSYSLLAFVVLANLALTLIRENSDDKYNSKVDNEEADECFRCDWESEEDMQEAMRWAASSLKETDNIDDD